MKNLLGKGALAATLVTIFTGDCILILGKEK
jgi:hypothetical protein